MTRTGTATATRTGTLSTTAANRRWVRLTWGRLPLGGGVPMVRVRRNNRRMAAVVLSVPVLVAVAVPVLVIAPVHGSDAARPQLYELTTETSMPHLEENLRYANTTRRQCLALSQLTTAFPILRHPALEG